MFERVLERKLKKKIIMVMSMHNSIVFTHLTIIVSIVAGENLSTNLPALVRNLQANH